MLNVLKVEKYLDSKGAVNQPEDYNCYNDYLTVAENQA